MTAARCWLLVLLIAPVSTAAAQSLPLPAEAVSEIQGKWVSRFSNDSTEIEIIGNDINLTINGQPKANPRPLGWNFKLSGLRREPYELNGRQRYSFSADCKAWNGKTWNTISKSCELIYVWYVGEDKKPYPMLSLTEIGDLFRYEDKKRLCSKRSC